MTRRLDRERDGRSGQGLVEFAILVPAFAILLFAMLEFGFVFSHHLTVEYATREGARVGAALGNGDDGVFIANSATGNTVGGTASGAANVISANGSDGVLISTRRPLALAASMGMTAA